MDSVDINSLRIKLDALALGRRLPASNRSPTPFQVRLCSKPWQASLFCVASLFLSTRSRAKVRWFCFLASVDLCRVNERGLWERISNHVLMKSLIGCGNGKSNFLRSLMTDMGAGISGRSCQHSINFVSHEYADEFKAPIA